MSQKRHMSTASEVAHIINDLKILDDVMLKSVYGIDRTSGRAQFYDSENDKLYKTAEDFANYFVDLEEADGGYDDPIMNKYSDEGDFR